MHRLPLLTVFSLFFIHSVSAFQPPRVTIIDDYEQISLPSGTDGDGQQVGYVTFAGAGGGIALSTTDTPPSQVPGSNPGNRVMNADMTLPTGSFTGYINKFANPAVDTWVTMDWSTYEGFQLWIYGNNTGGTLFVDILDNRNPGSTTDDAERYSLDIPDDFTGWQRFEFAWSDFMRKDVGNGAPNDGLGLTEVHGYAVGGFGSVDMGTNNYYVDSVAIWGMRDVMIPVEAQFVTDQYEVTEGATAQIGIELNVISTDPVTISYSTAESTAIPDRDFTPVSGMMTIPPGAESFTFPIPTFDNDKADGPKYLMVDISAADGADIGFLRRTRLTILDDDVANPDLIDDFEGCHPFQSEGNITAESIELALGDPNALPCQLGFEGVVEVSGGGTLSRTFAEPVDWTSATGLSFWYYGIGSNKSIAVKIKDNSSLTTSSEPPENWVLKWSDEFDDPAGTPPNPNVWAHELGDGGINGITGWGNAELQYYTNDPANASTDGNGNMVISMLELDPQTTDLVCFYGPCEYTSARLITKDKLAFKYGRLEARIRVPDGKDGLWPAFWSLGTDIDEVAWPQAGEIDIMEYVSRLPNEVFGTVHGPGYSGGASFGGVYPFMNPVADDYHTFAIEWIEDEIRWYVDGNLYHTAVPADVNPNEWVTNKPFFMLLNMAIGGNFGGPISDMLTFPQELLIDYVRVYQAEDTAECFESSFTDRFTGWQLIYLPFDEFTRSVDQPAGAPDDGLNLNEVEGYCLSLPDMPPINGGLLFDQVSLTDGTPEPPCFIAPIPTVSEWGLIALMLSFLIVGIVAVRKRIVSTY